MPLFIPKIPVCVAIGCSGVALVLQLVAVAGTGWKIWHFSGHFSEYSGENGMFRYCSDGRCFSGTSNIDWFVTCQVFSIMALVAIFGSVVVGVLHILREDTKRLTLPAAVMGAAAAVCVAVEVSVYAAKTKAINANTTLYTFSYGYDFYLSIVAGVLSVVTAILHLV